MKIGIVDYDAGNLTSVTTALAYLGYDFFVSGKPEELASSDKLIFPGVGEASSAMSILKKSGLDKFLREYYATGRPMMGICLGCQIILEFSEESSTECLGLVPGKSIRFPSDMGLKVPHIGWNHVAAGDHPVFRNIPENSSFYFVHSFYPEPEKKSSVIGTTEYGVEFSSAFSVDNLVAFQFHPEKSGPVGLKLLDNFIKG